LSQDASARERVFGLDLLRAVAILSVVYGHGYVLTNRAFTDEAYSIPVLDGVAMFFVLSGFLIGRILLKTVIYQNCSYKKLLEFWVRRWFRTIPNYLLVLIVIIVLNRTLAVFPVVGLWKYFIFSQNFASPHPAFFPEAWSLTVEEWFYLLVPVPLFLSLRFNAIPKTKAISVWIAAVIVAVTLLRFYRAQHYGYATYVDWDDHLRKQVITRLDSLMFGVLAAQISIRQPRLWGNAANLGFLAGLGLLLFNKFYWYGSHSMFYLNYFNLTVTSIGTFLLLPKLSTIRRDQGYVVRVVTFVSLISYSMYLISLSLVQLMVLPRVVAFLGALQPIFSSHPFITQYLGYWVMTLGGAFVLYRFYERPMTAIRERFRFSAEPAEEPFGAAGVTGTNIRER
jgi:peptidoglycan/LPS O-acetylase OafA/YrhL